MKTVYIDFETRSETSLDTSGAWVYSLQEDTEILCLAYKIEDSETKIVTVIQGLTIPDDLGTAIKEGCLFEAHNYFFEYAIWNNILVPKHQWPSVDITRFRCTVARSAQFALPRALKTCAELLQLDEKKDDEGRRIMLQMCKPRKITKTNSSMWYDDKERFDKLFDYCKRDVNTTYHLKKRLEQYTEQKNILFNRCQPASFKELDVFKLNGIVNLRGIHCDQLLAKNALKLIEHHEQNLNCVLQNVSGGEIQSANQVKKIIEFVNKHGMNVDNLQSKNVTTYLQTAEGVNKQVLEIRDALNKSSIRKIKTMLNGLSPDNRIRGLLVYHGAGRTGRFASSHLQVHNFIKPSISEEEINTIIPEIKKGTTYDSFVKRGDVFKNISSCLRGMLCAAKGNVFYDSDFSAIECRLVFWLAKETVGLQMYNNDIDIYREMAATVYGTDITNVTKEQRQLGKQIILGAGFGMFYEKFQKTCESYGMYIDEFLAKKAIDTYRSKFSKVVKFWTEIEEIVIKAVLQPKKLFQLRNIYVISNTEYLFIRLPSGRVMSYHLPKIIIERYKRPKIIYMGFNTQKKQYEEQRTHGGKLVENITQATARDVMVEAMFRVEKAGYPVVFTVHDQIICETNELFGSIEEFNKIIEIRPTWAQDCPIKAETCKTARFKK